MSIGTITTLALIGVPAVGTAPAEERRRALPAWAHDYTARDTIGPVAVREVSAECQTGSAPT
jgi:hypothetical protein